MQANVSSRPPAAGGLPGAAWEAPWSGFAQRISKEPSGLSANAPQLVASLSFGSFIAGSGGAAGPALPGPASAESSLSACASEAESFMTSRVSSSAVRRVSELDTLPELPLDSAVSLPYADGPEAVALALALALPRREPRLATDLPNPKRIPRRSQSMAFVVASLGRRLASASDGAEVAAGAAAAPVRQGGEAHAPSPRHALTLSRSLSVEVAGLQEPQLPQLLPLPQLAQPAASQPSRESGAASGSAARTSAAGVADLGAAPLASPSQQRHLGQQLHASGAHPQSLKLRLSGVHDPQPPLQQAPRTALRQSSGAGLLPTGASRHPSSRAWPQAVYQPPAAGPQAPTAVALPRMPEGSAPPPLSGGGWAAAPAAPAAAPPSLPSPTAATPARASLAAAALSRPSPAALLPSAPSAQGAAAAAALGAVPSRAVRLSSVSAPTLRLPPDRLSPTGLGAGYTGPAAATGVAAADALLAGEERPLSPVPAALRSPRQLSPGPAAPGHGRGSMGGGVGASGDAGGVDGFSSVGGGSGVGIDPRSDGVSLADVDAAPPSVTVRPPRWLNPSAFQIVEKLRTGRLQELAERLAAAAAPTLLDLGGLEFSGPITPAHSHTRPGTSAVQPAGPTAHSPSHRLPAPPPPPPGQVLWVPPGVHVTLLNATVLLTAEQHLHVGRGAALALKGVELLGCSRDAAAVSAAARRLARASAATAAAAASAAASAPPPDAAAAPPHGPASRKGARRASSPGREDASDRWLRATSLVAKRRSSTGVTADNPGPAGPLAPAAAAASSSPHSSQGPASPPPSSPAPWPPPPAGSPVSSSGSALGPWPPVYSPMYGSGAGTAAASFTSAGGSQPGLLHGLVDATEEVDEHALIEVVDGYLRASNCRIWPGRAQLALAVQAGGGAELSYSTCGPACAAGAGSTLLGLHTAFEGGAAGSVCAADGGRVAFTGCTLRGGLTDGLQARGGGSLAVLSDCDVYGTRGVGVCVSAGGAAHLASSRVRDCAGPGLRVAGWGSVLYGRGVRVEDVAAGPAALAAGGGALRLADCELSGAAAGPGLLLLGSAPGPADAARGGVATPAGGGRAGARPSPVGASPRAPPVAPGATRAVLLRVNLAANAGHGAHLLGAPAGGAARAWAGTAADTPRVSRSSSTHLAPQCSAELIRCEIYNNLAAGVLAEGPGAALAARSCRLLVNGAHGVRVAGGGAGALAGCGLLRNGADGVAVEGLGSSAQVASCECRENRESGLCVSGGAAASLSGCRLAANTHDGLAVSGSGSSAAATGCTLAGNTAKGVGVYLGAAAELAGCAVHANGLKSAQVSEEGSRLALGAGCTLDRPPLAVNGGVLVAVAVRRGG